MNTTNKNQSDDRGVWIALVVLLVVVPFVLFLLHWLNQELHDGELVLTAAGCEALRYHGAKVEPLGRDSLCAIRTKFRFYSGSQIATVRIVTADGPLDIELAGAEVVSQAVR